MKTSSVSRYLSVAEDDAPARFRVARRVEADFDPEWGLKELWNAHGDALDGYPAALEEKRSQPVSRSLLDLKVELARRLLSRCVLCTHRCRVDRTDGRTGVCGVGDESPISSDFLHLGEEPELVPSHTVFFGGCSLNCSFCQNNGIARLEERFSSPDPESLAESVKRKRRNDSKNVNWVGGDPGPHLAFVLETLNALDANVPSVWNSNMYLSRESMELLRGTQDLFLTDMKYGNDECAFELSDVLNYTGVVRRNHLLAAEQSEVLVRHLVLPGHVECCTEPVLNWISSELGPATRVNLMFQYRPQHEARDHPEVGRALTPDEELRAREAAESAGLTNFV